MLTEVRASKSGKVSQRAMKSRPLFLTGAICLLISAVAPVLVAGDTETGNPTSSAPALSNNAVSVSTTHPYPRNVSDVVKLVKSGTDEAVVLAFIDNSPLAFQPSATDIIRLRDEGVSSKVIVSMLKHEVQPPPQPQWAAAPQAVPQSVSAPVEAAPQPEAQNTTETTPNTTVIYSGSQPYYYGTYPYYSWYWWYWPYPYYYSSYYYHGHYPYYRYGHYPGHYPGYGPGHGPGYGSGHPSGGHPSPWSPAVSHSSSPRSFAAGVNVGGAVHSASFAGRATFGGAASFGGGAHVGGGARFGGGGGFGGGHGGGGFGHR
jgi:hypothetical protein